MKNFASIIILLFLFSCQKDNEIKESNTNDFNIIRSTVEKEYSSVLIDGKSQKNKLISYCDSRFDKNKRILEFNSYTSDGRVDARIVYTYKNSELFEAVQYGLNGVIEFRYNGKINGVGNTIEENIYSPSGLLKIKIEYIYNSLNQVTEEITYDYDKADGFQKESNFYEYDENGNTTKCLTYNYNGKLVGQTTYSYPELDKNKNWLTKIENFSTASYIVERTIEYY